MSKRARFADLIADGALEIGDGYRAKLEELGGSGPVFLRAGALTDRGFEWSGLDRFHENLRERLASKLGFPGDVVITTKGNSTGRVGFVSENAPAFVYSPHLSYWRSLDRRCLAPGYLRYWSNSAECAEQVFAMAHGTDMAPYLSLADQKRLLITLPPLRQQEAISDVLGALDDKIAANDRTVELCDQLRPLALAQYRSANPDGFYECELSSLADFINGRAFTKHATGTGRMVVRIAELNSGPGASTVYNDIEVPDVHLAQPGDVLFAWSGSLTVARWFRSEAIVNQHIFKVVPRGNRPAWLLFGMIHDLLGRFRGIAADKATTMGHIQRHHLDVPVATPTDDALPELDAMLGPVWDRALTAEQESVALIELRNALLPRLMSGEIRVRDAEKVMEEAL